MDHARLFVIPSVRERFDTHTQYNLHPEKVTPKTLWNDEKGIH
jgi:hypothetical protein